MYRVWSFVYQNRARSFVYQQRFNHCSYHGQYILYWLRPLTSRSKSCRTNTLHQSSVAFFASQLTSFALIFALSVGLKYLLFAKNFLVNYIILVGIWHSSKNCSIHVGYLNSYRVWIIYRLMGRRRKCVMKRHRIKEQLKLNVCFIFSIDNVTRVS